MARKKTIQELQQKQQKLEQELKIKQQTLKELRKRESELARRERTHRLCNHGGLLECFLPADQYTDEQMETILKEIFRNPEIKKYLEKMKSGR